MNVPGLLHPVLRAVREALVSRDFTLPPLPEDLDPTKLGHAVEQLDALLAGDEPEGLVEWASVAQQAAAALSDLGKLEGAASEILLSRMLQLASPHAAGLLAMLGVIKPSGTLNGKRLEMIFSDPTDLIAAGTAAKLASIEGPELGMLLAMWMSVPTVGRLLANDSLRVQAVPLPGAQGPTGWPAALDAASDWYTMTVPLRRGPDPGKQGGLAPYQKIGLDPEVLDRDQNRNPDAEVFLAVRGHASGPSSDRHSIVEFWLFATTGSPPLLSWNLGKGWSLSFSGGTMLGFALQWPGEWNWQQVSPKGYVGTGTAATGKPFEVVLAHNAPWRLGPPNGSRFQLGTLALRAALSGASVGQTPVWEFGVRVTDVAAVLSPDWLKALGAESVVGGELNASVPSLEGVYTTGKGFHMSGSAGAGAESRVPINRTYGTGTLRVHLTELLVGLEAKVDFGQSTALVGRLKVRMTADLTLGPIYAGVEAAGAWVGWWPAGGRRAAVGFLKPQGMALRVDLPAVSGGGSLSREQQPDDEAPPDRPGAPAGGGRGERHKGSLALRVLGFGVKAYGIYEHTPAGHTSVVGVLGATFHPGLQLGYGFALVGVGGLVGIHRSIDADAMRSRVTTGALGNALFTDDPVGAGPRIFADLQAMFPPSDSTHVVGPMARIEWGAGLVTADIAVLIEFPGPSKVVLAGSARVEVVNDTGVRLVAIRVDVLGVLDLGAKTLTFDAALVDSTLLEKFALSGSAAFRSCWGARPYAVLSLGGFHPRYHPEPAVFPPMERLGIALDLSAVKVTVTGYFAVAPTAVMFGGAIHAELSLGKLKVIGELGIDALFQYPPLYLDVELYARVSVRYKGRRIASVDLDGRLWGPPMKLHGSASIEICWVEIRGAATLDLTTEEAPEEPAVDPVAELARALSAGASVAAEPDADCPLVAAPMPPGQDSAGIQRVLVAPGAAVTWSQRRLPFGMTVERLDGGPVTQRVAFALAGCPGTAVTSGGRTVEVTLTLTGEQDAAEPVWDDFGSTSFREATDSDRLGSAAFTRLASGARLRQRMVCAAFGGLDVAIDTKLRGGPGSVQSAPLAPRSRRVVLPLPRLQPVDVCRQEARLSGCAAEQLPAIRGRGLPASADTIGSPPPTTDPPWVVPGSNAQPTSAVDAAQAARAMGKVALQERDVFPLPPGLKLRSSEPGPS